MKPLTLEQLKELEAKIRELVPEMEEEEWRCECIREFAKELRDHDCDHCSLDKRNISFLEELNTTFSLEHCRVAIKKEFPNMKCVEDGFVYMEDSILTELGMDWQDLQPWESQAEVHSFLYSYLVK